MRYNGAKASRRRECHSVKGKLVLCKFDNNCYSFRGTILYHVRAKKFTLKYDKFLMWAAKFNKGCLAVTSKSYLRSVRILLLERGCAWEMWRFLIVPLCLNVTFMWRHWSMRNYMKTFRMKAIIWIICLLTKYPKVFFNYPETNCLWLGRIRMCTILRNFPFNILGN